jgi:hypothetical protein
MFRPVQSAGVYIRCATFAAISCRLGVPFGHVFWVLTLIEEKLKGEGKDHPRTGHEGPEGE